MKKSKIYALSKGSVSNQMFAVDMLGAVLKVAKRYGASVGETKMLLKEIHKKLDDFVVVQDDKIGYQKDKGVEFINGQNNAK